MSDFSAKMLPMQGVRKLVVQTLTVGINTQNNDFFKNK